MIADLFNTTCSVTRKVWTTDGSGNDYASDSTIGTVAAYISQTSAQIAQFAGLAFTKSYMVYCPFGSDVAEGDKLICGNYTYHVKGVQEFPQGDNAHLELLCERELKQNG